MTLANNFFARLPWLRWSLEALLLAAVIVLFEVTDWDLKFQDLFYSVENGWAIHMHKTSGPGLFYYTIPKYIIGWACGLLTVSLFLPRKRLPKWWFSRWRTLYVLICVAATPCVVANLKTRCNMPYPSKIVRYGGMEPKRGIVEAFRQKKTPGVKWYHGWPAGHASGGFAWFGLAFAPLTLRGKRRGFLLALAAGAMMGFFHTIDGNHFISHTLVSGALSILLADLLFAICRKLLLSLQWRLSRKCRLLLG